MRPPLLFRPQLLLLALLAAALTLSTLSAAPARAAEFAPDLATTWEPTADPLEVGIDRTLTVHVRNQGTAGAGDAALALTQHDPRLTIRSATAAGAGPCEVTAGGAAASCQLGGMATGDQRTVTLVVTPLVTGELRLHADATSTPADATPANDHDELPLRIAATDLSVTQSDTPDPAKPGVAVRHTVTVRNAGPLTARDARVNVGWGAADGAVGQAVTLVPGSVAGAACLGASGLSCDVGDLEPGGTRTVTFALEAAKPGLVHALARVGTATHDVDATNDTADETTRIDDFRADLSIVKTVDRPTVALGDAVAFTLTVRNAGPDAARDVVVADDLDARLGLVGAQASQGTCAGDPAVRCALGTIPAGGTATVRVVVAAAAAGHVVNTATVGATTADPDAAGNRSSAAVDVTPPVCTSITAPSTAPTSARVALTPGAAAQINGPPGAFVRLGGRGLSLFRIQVDGRAKHGVVRGVDFSLDGGAARTGRHEPKSESPAWNIRIGSRGLTRGTHTMQATLHLVRGGTKTVELTFKADTCPPAFLRVFVRDRSTGPGSHATDLRLRVGSGDASLGRARFALPARVRVHASRASGIRAGVAKLTVGGKITAVRLVARRTRSGGVSLTSGSGVRIRFGSGARPALTVDRLPRRTTHVDLQLKGQPSGLLTVRRGCAVSSARVTAADLAGARVALRAVNRDRC